MLSSTTEACCRLPSRPRLFPNSNTVSNSPSSGGICSTDPTTALTPRCVATKTAGRGVQADYVMSGLRQRQGMAAGSTSDIQHAAGNTLASPALDRRP